MKLPRIVTGGIKPRVTWTVEDERKCNVVRL